MNFLMRGIRIKFMKVLEIVDVLMMNLICRMRVIVMSVMSVMLIVSLMIDLMSVSLFLV